MPASGAPRFLVEWDDVPPTCPGCSFRSNEPEAMVEHWIRAKAYTPKGKDFMLNPFLAHQSPERASLNEGICEPIPMQITLIAIPRVEQPEITVELGPVRYLLTAGCVLGVVFLGLLCLTLAALLIPLAWYPLVKWGPGKPIATLISFGWDHGEVGATFLLCWAFVLGYWPTRQKLMWFLQAWTLKFCIGTLIGAAFALVAWATGIALGMWR